MANIPSSSDIVNREQQPLLTDEVQLEILPMPEMADSASSNDTEATMVDSSGTLPERQEERSLWREKVEHRLRIAKEILQCKTDGFQILKVPEYHRQPPEMFTPVGWRIGLHNLDDVDRYSATEAMKRCVPLLFGLDKVDKWEKFCDYVVPDHTRMLGCYGLHKEAINLTGKEIKQLLATDALCIAMIEDFWNTKSEKRIICGNVTAPEDEQRMFVSGFNAWSAIFDHDMGRVENQIPLQLVTRAIEYIKTPFSQLVPKPDETNANGEMWMKEAVRTTIREIISDEDDDGYAQEISDLRLSETHHILDGAYKVICGKKSLERKWEVGILTHISSAIHLKHVGVKIEGVGTPLCTMAYKEKTKSLILPKMITYSSCRI